MSRTASIDPSAAPASEAIELEAVISSEREENTEARRDSDQTAKEETEDHHESKEDVKPKSKFISN